MKSRTLAGLMAAPLLIFAFALTARAADPAATTCQDGTTSTSTGKGTCSGNGRTRRARQERRSDDLRGWQYKYLDRQGHVQRPWRRTKSYQGCTCEGGSRERAR